jgi:hypothetical protein
MSLLKISLAGVEKTSKESVLVSNLENRTKKLWVYKERGLL